MLLLRGFIEIYIFQPLGYNEAESKGLVGVVLQGILTNSVVHITFEPATRKIKCYFEQLKSSPV